ncbi:MAG: phosphoribosylglycinamide formyltransferase [Verrucomicrobia bacterium]|nr:phosphoribosylglycinamide formyltransferase [Verrucomicrobiota bacterium]MDA1065666.1 phosphoribosylglycinamide formyltransferase [Verrucomicrobiota bacterium]
MSQAPVRVAVLGSTRGSSLQPVIEAIEAGELNATIVSVISNRKKSGILERARTHYLKDYFISAKDKEREEFDREVSKVLIEEKADLILCIGYMRFLSKEFVNKWHGKVTNVHPSLLPKHPGLMDLEVHQAVLDAGDTETGCTVHLIDEGIDSGPILIQLKVAVAKEDTAESLKAKVQPMEGRAFVQLIKQWPMKAIPQDRFTS